MVEKALFLGQISGVEMLMDLHIMKSPEFENHIFNGWFVFASVISRDQKQIASKSPKF